GQWCPPCCCRPMVCAVHDEFSAHGDWPLRSGSWAICLVVRRHGVRDGISAHDANWSNPARAADFGVMFGALLGAGLSLGVLLIWRVTLMRRPTLWQRVVPYVPAPGTGPVSTRPAMLSGW